MSLGFCIYHMVVDVDTALNAFVKIVDRLGLSGERVVVEAPKRIRRKRMAIDRLESFNSIFSELDAFSFESISSLSPDAVASNDAPHVTYRRGTGLDQMMIFSPEQADLCNFAKQFLRDIPGKYGFGMDWNRPGSFFGYTAGIDDFESLGRRFFGISDAGRWGTLYLQNYSTVFDEPIIRDIYPVNLLTTAHLDREACDGTVRDLVREHKEWGEITKLAEDWFLWCVPASEIDAARNAFESRGLLKNNPSGFFRQGDGN
jgi:hypothetical protein